VAKNFYSYNTGKTDGTRDKNQKRRVEKGTVYHMYGTGRGVTSDNFLTSRELTNLLLTRNMTLVGKLRKNEPAVPALFLSGKQKQAYSSIFGFSNDLTLVLHVPARNKAVILLSSQHHDDTCMGRKKIANLKSSFKIMSLKVGFDVQSKLVRECTCTSSTWRWHLKLLLSFIDVVCVNAYVLWVLKYPNWQERKNHRRHLYLLSVGAIMVRSHIRKRADSGNIDILRAMRARDVCCKQPTSPTTVKKGGGRRLGRCSICPAAKDRRTDWKY